MVYGIAFGRGIVTGRCRRHAVPLACAFRERAAPVRHWQGSWRARCPQVCKRPRNVAATRAGRRAMRTVGHRSPEPRSQPRRGGRQRGTHGRAATRARAGLL